MMGLISCYNEYAIQVSNSSSCKNYTSVSSSISSNLTPSIQTAATCLYKTTLSTGKHHLITVTWCRPSTTTHGLQINSGDDPSTAFRLNTHSRFFRKTKGSKAFEINNSKFEIFYDLSSAQYDDGAEPSGGYYVFLTVDSELGLFLGDLTAKKVKTHTKIANFSLVCRREHFSGNRLYATKAQFSGAGSWHEILIRCSGVKEPVLLVCIDKQVVARVKRLQWNFRGNQTIFVDGLSVDLMWDVHDWFYSSGSGHAVFMLRTRSGSDNRLWLEEKKEPKEEFSLLIHGTKS